MKYIKEAKQFEEDYYLEPLLEKLHISDNMMNVLNIMADDHPNSLTDLLIDISKDTNKTKFTHDNIDISPQKGFLSFNNGKLHIKVGRFINQLLKNKNINCSEEVDDRFIELFVDYFERLADYYRGDIDNKKIVVLSGSDITRAYKAIKDKTGYSGTIAHSCMNTTRDYQDNPIESFFDIYERNHNIRLATYWEGEPFESKLLARALLWDNVECGIWEDDEEYEDCPKHPPSKDKIDVSKIMDRIYYNDSFVLNYMRNWAKNNGYAYRDSQDINFFMVGNKRTRLTLRVKLSHHDFDWYPYMDTFYYSDTNGNFQNHDEWKNDMYWVYHSLRGVRTRTYNKRKRMDRFRDFTRRVGRSLDI